MVQFATTVPVTANELVAVAARAPGVAISSASSKAVQNARRSFRELAVRVFKMDPGLVCQPTGREDGQSRISIVKNYRDNVEIGRRLQVSVSLPHTPGALPAPI